MKGEEGRRVRSTDVCVGKSLKGKAETLYVMKTKKNGGKWGRQRCVGEGLMGVAEKW